MSPTRPALPLKTVTLTAGDTAHTKRSVFALARVETLKRLEVDHLMKIPTHQRVEHRVGSWRTSKKDRTSIPPRGDSGVRGCWPCGAGRRSTPDPNRPSWISTTFEGIHAVIA